MNVPAGTTTIRGQISQSDAGPLRCSHAVGQRRQQVAPAGSRQPHPGANPGPAEFVPAALIGRRGAPYTGAYARGDGSRRGSEPVQFQPTNRVRAGRQQR